MDNFAQKLEILIRGPVWSVLNQIEDPRLQLEARAAFDQLIEIAENAHEQKAKGDSNSFALSEDPKQLVEDLIQARDEARAVAKLKSEFVANMSHEIRTPLNGLLGMVEILLRTELTESAREYTLLIKEAGKTLLNILTDILDFSKIEAGHVEISHCEFELTSLIEGVGEILSPQADGKNLLLTTFIDTRIPNVLVGDPLRLRQILLNLAGNAIKFTNSGNVTIRADLQSRSELDGAGQGVKIAFSVIDTGIGMSPDGVKKLFEPFVQIDGSIGRRYGGTGLGLSIAKRLVELLGGNIEIKSAVGEGSTFSFAVNFGSIEKQISEIAPELNALYNSTVIVIDSDSELRNSIVHYCSSFGRKAISCRTVAEGIELINSVLKTGASANVIVDGVRHSDYTLDLFERQFFGRLHEAQKLFLLTTRDKKNQTEALLPSGAATTIIRPIRLNVLRYYLNFSDNQKNKTIERHSATIKRQTGAAKMKALIADDNKLNQQVAKLMLEDLGLEVEVVENGMEAVDSFNSSKYDVVFLDCHMPELDGYAAARIIKKLQEQSGTRIPVIAMTANVMAGSREACLASGMDEYMAKPIEPAELERVLRLWTDGTKGRQGQAIEQISSTVVIEQKAELTEKPPTLTAIKYDILKERFTDANAKKLLTMFIESLPAEFEDLREKLAQKDYSSLKAAAHALKGACGTVCASQLYETLQSLEAASRDADGANCSELLIRMESEVNAVLTEVPAHL